MSKKIILIVLLINSFLFARDIDFEIQNKQPNGAITVACDTINSANKDWIAIYPKGSSADWNNVIKWKWVRELPKSKGLYYFLYSDAFQIKKTGDYEIRYFKDNTYEIYKSFDFTIKSSESYLSNIYIDGGVENELRVMLDGFTKGVTAPAKLDWIGIYKKGDNNDWNNVLQWKWAKDTFWDMRWKIMNIDEKSDKYEAGVQYEVRYFLNNSYQTYKKSKPFRVKDPKYTITLKYDSNAHVSIFGFNNKDLKPYAEPYGDWIAIYNTAGGKPIETTRAKNLRFDEGTQAYIYTLNSELYDPNATYIASYNSVGRERKSAKTEPFHVK